MQRTSRVLRLRVKDKYVAAAAGARGYGLICQFALFNSFRPEEIVFCEGADRQATMPETLRREDGTRGTFGRPTNSMQRQLECCLERSPAVVGRDLVDD
jgi:hypothetical protein